MKQFLAAVMALSMLTTVALAADYTPGQEITFDGDEGSGWSEAPDKNLNKSNYSIISQSWTNGKTMVASVTLSQDEDSLVVTLKEDYTMTKDKALEGTIKLRDKEEGTYITLTIDGDVGYTQATIDLDTEGYASLSTAGVDDDTIYTVTADDGDKPYGTLTFNAGDADVTVRVYEDEVYYLGYNFVPDKEVLLANADTEEDISFINFDAAPTFNSTATISFYLEEGTNIYELKSGRLVKANATWNEETNAYELKTRTLGTYVFSLDTLKAASSSSSSDNVVDNPDTGANDVVGIATALATVALVSAAAVSLKK